MQRGEIEALPTTGRYIDHAGKEWFCVARKDGMICDTQDGWFTAAYFETFRRWGWKLSLTGADK